MSYVTYAIPFFVLAMLLEAVYGQARGRQTYRMNDTVNSLSMGTLSRLKGILALSFSGLVFSHAVGFFGVTPLGTSNPFVWIIGFVAYDLCYYWKHRFGHEWRILWAAHAAHHQSEEYNLSTALRQTGTDYIGFVFYLPLYLVGLPLEVVITVGSLNLIYQFWVHTEHVGKLGILEWVLITPSNHRVHHARNPRYLDKNYGGVFIIWDRIFGTFKEEQSDEPCVYGITRGLKSWNPLWANLHVWYETALISIRTKRWGDKVSVWFRGPGWFPEDQQPAEKTHWQDDKYDPDMNPAYGVYCFIQYWLLTGMGLALIAVQADLPRSGVLGMFFWFCLSFYCIGQLMERGSNADMKELGRLLLLTVPLGYGFILEVGAGYLITLAGYALVSLVMGLFVKAGSS